MMAWLVILLCFYGSVCQLNGAAAHSKSHSVADILTALDKRISRLEDILATKEARITQLEERLNIELVNNDELRRGMDQVKVKLESHINEKDDKIRELEAKLDAEIKKRKSEISGLTEKMTNMMETLKECSYQSYGEDDGDGIAARKDDVLEPRGLDNITGRHTVASKGNQDNMVKSHLESNHSKGRIVRRFKRVATSSSTVAFHTELTTAKTLVNGVIMIFNNKLLDQGNGYNPQDGIYTVPVSGTYVITWKVISEINTFIYTALIVNGVEKGHSLTNSEDITDKHQSTAIVVLRLEEGDHLFIRVTKTNTGNVVSSTLHGYPTLSGWKI
ncbi:uncharacterized protein [Argopecten irradians]|uniref:uncharacterized protein isoform X1 n=1 Tax=Argopecten irradians TaxID=31199 RepID=UPI0037238E83